MIISSRCTSPDSVDRTVSLEQLRIDVDVNVDIDTDTDTTQHVIDNIHTRQVIYDNNLFLENMPFT